MKWTTKCYPRRPSDYDVGVLTPDGIYLSVKNQDGDLDPPLSLRIHDAYGQPNSTATAHSLPSSPSWHPSLSTSPACSIVYERTEDQPDIMRSDDTLVHSSEHLIVPITGTGHPSPNQSLCEPFTSELSFALLPGPSPRSSQSYGTPTVGMPRHLPHPNPHAMPAVSQAHGAPLHSVATENSASLARCVSALTADTQHYLPLGTINAHSTPQVHVMTAMETQQTTLENSWNELDFLAMSATPMARSTPFSADYPLPIGEFEQHHGSGVTTPLFGFKEQPQSNDLSEGGMTGEYWQLNRGSMHSSPMNRSRGLSPIDMGVYELPGTGEGDETLNRIYDACLFSNGFPAAFGR
jgi:hypothetical protein